MTKSTETIAHRFFAQIEEEQRKAWKEELREKFADLAFVSGLPANVSKIFTDPWIPANEQERDEIAEIAAELRQRVLDRDKLEGEILDLLSDYHRFGLELPERYSLLENLAWRVCTRTFIDARTKIYKDASDALDNLRRGIDALRNANAPVENDDPFGNDDFDLMTDAELEAEELRIARMSAVSTMMRDIESALSHFNRIIRGINTGSIMLNAAHRKVLEADYPDSVDLDEVRPKVDKAIAACRTLNQRVYRNELLEQRRLWFLEQHSLPLDGDDLVRVHTHHPVDASAAQADSIEEFFNELQEIIDMPSTEEETIAHGALDLTIGNGSTITVLLVTM